MTQRDPTPCDSCINAPRCKDNSLACESFHDFVFTGDVPNPGHPSRFWYLKLFDDIGDGNSKILRIYKTLRTISYSIPRDTPNHILFIPQSNKVVRCADLANRYARSLIAKGAIRVGSLSRGADPMGIVEAVFELQSSDSIVDLCETQDIARG